MVSSPPSTGSAIERTEEAEARMSDEESDFARPLADMMAGLAVIFLMVAAIFAVRGSVAEDVANQREKETADKLATTEHKLALAEATDTNARTSLKALVHGIEVQSTKDPST